MNSTHGISLLWILLFNMLRRILVFISPKDFYIDGIRMPRDTVINMRKNYSGDHQDTAFFSITNANFWDFFL